MLKRFWRARTSNAAIEFALIAPTLVALLLGVVEICNAVLVYQEVQNTAHAIPLSASNFAVQGNGATALTYPQIQLAASEIWAEIPELRDGFQDGTKSVVISSVTFIKTLPDTPAGQTNPETGYCTPTQTPKVVHCNYTPTVVWSVAYTGGDSGRTFLQDSTVLRSCTTISPADTAQVIPSGQAAAQALPGALNNDFPPTAQTAPSWSVSDLSSLPTANVASPDPYLAAPSPIIVVDVRLQYRPLFGLFLKSTGISFDSSGFYPVRSVQSSTINTAKNGTVTTVSQSLSQQFTTITTGTATPGEISGAAAGTYCINTSPLLSPQAETS